MGLIVSGFAFYFLGPVPGFVVLGIYIIGAALADQNESKV